MSKLSPIQRLFDYFTRCCLACSFGSRVSEILHNECEPVQTLLIKVTRICDLALEIAALVHKSMDKCDIKIILPNKLYDFLIGVCRGSFSILVGASAHGNIQFVGTSARARVSFVRE